MNAIERLRAMSTFTVTPAEFDAAVAAVDELYQAAKALDEFPFATAYDRERDAVDVVSEAVRRVEGE